jgi:predicted HTH transcriptional regulator
MSRFNPDVIYNQFDEEEFLNKLFRMVRLAENAGFGFDKMDTNWKACNNNLPEYVIAFDSTIVKLSLQEFESKKETILTDQILLKFQTEFGTIPERIKISPETNISFLRGIYGVFTGYLRGKSGIDKRELQRKGLMDCNADGYCSGGYPSKSGRYFRSVSKCNRKERSGTAQKQNH